jgi:non-specific serine/threonine protein kinase
MTSEPSLFGSLLRRYRLAAGLSQEQLAARAGISTDAVATLEQGKRRFPHASTVNLLTTALALSEAERAELLAAAQPVPVHAVTARGSVDTQETALSLWHITAQPTPLVDRTDELATVLHRLTAERVRLLTLTGPAGVGKTRLALEIAASLSDIASDAASLFPDGVIWVDLTPVRDPQDVLAVIGRAFGFTDTGQPPVGERLSAYLQERAVLVVLDNFEQVLPVAAMTLANLLGCCPHLVVLVTSREPLQVRWEQVLRVAPLPVPDLSAALPPVDTLLAVPSVELFVARARARRADFALSSVRASLMAELAVQLDGLPLALELAAARLDVLPLPNLVQRLGERLQLLASKAPDLPERQRSLEAAVGWSYDLLSTRERRLFRCLGVFVGRVTRDAIAAVIRALEADVGDDEVNQAKDREPILLQLISLAEKSLVLPAQDGERSVGALPGLAGRNDEPEEDEDGEPAFGMLETVREYAQEQLVAQGELEAARRAHARYFLTQAEQAAQQLRRREQRDWYLWLEHEHDNLRSALRWLLDQAGPDGSDAAAEREAGLRLAGALGYFWYVRGYHSEGLRWLEEAMVRAPQGEGVDVAARIHALVAAGPLFMMRADYARARAVLEQALELAQQRQEPQAAAEAVTYLGHGTVLAGDVENGTRRLYEALRCWEALGDPSGLGETLFYLGYAKDVVGDASAAAGHYTAALRQLGDAGNAQHAGFVHCYLGVAEGLRGELSRAVAQVQAGLQTSIILRDRWLLSYAVQATVSLAGAHAQATAGARMLGAADALAQATGATLAWERLPGGHDVAELRKQLAREEWSSAYREGLSLPFEAVAALAVSLLEEIAKTLSGGKFRTAVPGARPQPTVTGPLSSREQEVLRLVAQGLSSKEISRQLFLAPSTVNYYLTGVFNKLGVSTRAQAVAVATQRGLL